MHYDRILYMFSQRKKNRSNICSGDKKVQWKSSTQCCIHSATDSWSFSENISSWQTSDKCLVSKVCGIYILQNIKHDTNSCVSSEDLYIVQGKYYYHLFRWEFLMSRHHINDMSQQNRFFKCLWHNFWYLRHHNYGISYQHRIPDVKGIILLIRVNKTTFLISKAPFSADIYDISQQKWISESEFLMSKAPYSYESTKQNRSGTWHSNTQLKSKWLQVSWLCEQ